MSSMKAGDIVELGRHRLMCGDATNPEHMSQLMGAEKCDLIFTDPPYLCAPTMDRRFYKSDDPATSKWLGSAMSDLTEAKWDVDFDISSFLGTLSGHIPRNGTVYVCASHFIAPAIWQWMRDEGARQHNYVVWCKTNPMPSMAKRHPTWATELICYGTWGKHTFNFPANGHALNWWAIPKNTPNRVHPTQKPVSIVRRAIEQSSNEMAVVLDPCGGSGTTLIASEEINRSSRIMELSPDYCQVIIDRYHKMTAQPSLLAEAVA